MSLYFWKSEFKNFGDELNRLLWAEIFDERALDAADVEVWGLGSLLGGTVRDSRKKLVLGSGSLGRAAPVGVPGWDIRWVRGPLTAKALGVSEALGLGDPAVLWTGLSGAVARPTGPVAIAPHWRTWLDYDWRGVAEMAGLVAINPMQSVREVTQQLRSCSAVLAESLHAGIFADTLGIPWAPVVLAHRFNEFKWRDWMLTIHREFSPFVIAQPLVQSMPRSKVWLNRLGRLAGYSRNTFSTSLRPIRPATTEDVNAVASQLRQFAQDSSKFNCSSRDLLDAQRVKMLEQCRQASVDYMLGYRGPAL